MHGIVPTRAALLARRVNIVSFCPLCELHVETLDHVLLGCPCVASLWAGLGFNMGQEHVLVEWFQQLIIMDKKVGEKVAFVLDEIWQARNKLVRSATPFIIQAVKVGAAAKYEYWKEHGSVRHVGSGGGCRSPVTWVAPPVGFLKCNVDASVMTEEGRAGFGAVVCDENGAFVAAVGGSIAFTPDIVMAEALALKEALSWLQDMNYRKVQVETDCQMLTRILTSQRADLSYLGVVVYGIKDLEAGFESLSINHVRRSANKMAHALARSVCLDDDVGYWSDAPPTCILDHMSSS
ncbi:hypothetical protein OROMI_007134 [Orobanche minor]